MVCVNGLRPIAKAGLAMSRKTSKEKPAQLRPVPACDADLLPEVLRPWAVDIAERMQCPLDFVAVALMIVLAAVVGRQVGIRPKLRDSWLVIANLWGLLIGRPGVMKSPPMKETTKPLARLEIRAAEEHSQAVREYESTSMVAEVRRKVTQAELAKAVKGRNDDAHKLASDSLEEEEAPPVRRRYIVNDPTPEKLQVILSENPNGVLVQRDEAQGFLRSLDKPGREDARAFYLECWNGDGRFTVDRIGRGTLDIPACCVSILATIQPGPLESYLFATVAGGAGDDGLAPRFQLAVWPDVNPVWRNVDRWPDKAAKQKAFEVFEQLANLDPWAIDAQEDEDGDGVPFLRFDAKAQAAFNEWRGDLERTLRTDTLPPALEAVLAKHRSLIPSIALLLHLADSGRGPVPISALDKAVGWGRYLFAHAQRIYGSLPTEEDSDRQELVEWVRRKGGAVTVRQLQQGIRRFRSNAEAAEAALMELVKLRCGEWADIPPDAGGGRPTRVFRLHGPSTVYETPSNPEENVSCVDVGSVDTDKINSLLDEVAAMELG
jgi:hypothetical protein